METAGPAEQLDGGAAARHVQFPSRAGQMRLYGGRRQGEVFGDLTGLHIVRHAFQAASLLTGQAGGDDPVDITGHAREASERRGAVLAEF